MLPNLVQSEFVFIFVCYRCFHHCWVPVDWMLTVTVLFPPERRLGGGGGAKDLSECGLRPSWDYRVAEYEIRYRNPICYQVEFRSHLMFLFDGLWGRSWRRTSLWPSRETGRSIIAPISSQVPDAIFRFFCKSFATKVITLFFFFLSTEDRGSMTTLESCVDGFRAVSYTGGFTPGRPWTGQSWRSSPDRLLTPPLIPPAVQCKGPKMLVSQQSEDVEKF